MKRSAENPAEGIRRLYRPGDKQGRPTGRYQARYTVRHADGTKSHKTAGTFATLADAKDARSLQIAKLRTGDWVDPLGPKTTVQTWSDQWHELRRGRNTKEASFLRRITAYWGERRIGDISAIEVQQWVHAMTDEGLAPATVQQVYATFKHLMADAVEHDLLVKTPCRRVELPTAARHEPTKLSVADLLRIESAAPARFRAMVHLSAWAGLRWQECAALRWEDVDLENGLLRVTQSVKVDGRVGVPKNGKSRVVPIGSTTVDVLRAHRRDFGTADLLFVGPRDGRQLGYANFRKNIWTPLMITCGLRATWHDLRHAHVAHMRRVGMDLSVLSQRVGHHKESFTADRYGWVREDFHAVSVAAIEAAMRGE